MNQDISQKFRRLPSVDALLNTDAAANLRHHYGHGQTVRALRMILDETRVAIRAGEDVPNADALLRTVKAYLTTRANPTLRPVINATGVILHTNLGRAPLSTQAIDAIQAVAAGYSTLEYDLAAGQRGKRDDHIAELVCDVTGAEGALVVNNNAAAVLLILMAFAQGQETLISRGQLVQIGGGFRVPDVMTQSGSILAEVGTTNRTSLADYAKAITEQSAMIMVAHASNFRIVGFTEEPDLAELTDLAHEHDLIMAYDVGSGALLDTAEYGLQHEPTVQEALNAGCDLVCFSGDKLLGGPQAGIIVGRADLVATLKRHPFARAVRMDKLDLAGLSATLTSYWRDTALDDIPIWQMISMMPETIQQRAQQWADQLGQGEVIAAESTVGGGSLPGETLPTYALALTVGRPDQFADALREEPLPIIARIVESRILFDPRTVFPGQEAVLLASLDRLLAAWQHDEVQDPS